MYFFPDSIRKPVSKHTVGFGLVQHQPRGSSRNDAVCHDHTIASNHAVCIHASSCLLGNTTFGGYIVCNVRIAGEQRLTICSSNYDTNIYRPPLNAGDKWSERSCKHAWCGRVRPKPSCLDIVSQARFDQGVQYVAARRAWSSSHA